MRRSNSSLSVRVSLVAAASIGLAARAFPVPITYTFGGTASGAINLATFTDAPFTITVEGDTAAITHSTPTTLILPVQAVIAIAGFPPVTVTDGLSMFDNQGFGIAGIYRSGGDMLDINDPAFLSYALAANLGPLSLVGAPSVGNFAAVPTSSGTVTISSVGGATFQAQVATNVAWIPVVSHTAGAGGSQWRSDTGLLNASTLAEATVSLRLHTASGILSTVVGVPRAGQIVVRDVAAILGMSNGSAALEVVSDQPVVATSRTYNRQPSGLTFGQGYDGLATADGVSAGESALLPQLSQTGIAGQVGTSRTNIGITNTGPDPANVTLTLFDGTGSPLWSDTRSYDTGEWFQYQEPFRTGAGRIDIGEGFAVITVNSGAGVVAYASVIDNASSDPTTITMKR